MIRRALARWSSYLFRPVECRIGRPCEAYSVMGCPVHSMPQSEVGR